MINFSSLRGRARRASGPARHRTGRYAFAPSMIESLEGRRLLAAGPLGINVEISPFASFVNVLQTTPNWTNFYGQTNPIVLNSSGDPTSDADFYFDLRVNQFFNGPDPNAVGQNLSGTYHLSFNGQATISDEFGPGGTQFTVQNQAYNASTNMTTADLVVPITNPWDFFGVALSNTQATPTSAVGTGFSNAKLIRPGYAAGSTQLYSNEFLAALKPYTVLRYLDPENTNNQPFFNGNTLVTVDAPQVDQTGMPWEYLIALANQSNTDMWINVPQGATNAYVTALAGIFKNGGTVGGVAYAGLNPNLKIYLEYSNEVWGGIPANEYYQNSAVQNSATDQPLSTFPSNLDIYNNVDGSTTTDVNTAVGRRYLERTNDISQIFQGVLGADPTHQRIRPVLGWQEDNTSFFSGALDWFQHYFGAASTAFYGMGDANYWSPTDYSSVDAIINSLAAQETSFSIPETLAFTTEATAYGLKNVSYEGGPSIGGDGTTAAGQNALAASRDPRMEQLIYQHYVDFYAGGGDVAAFYDGPFVTWTPQNEWSVAEPSQYGNPTASAKYRGTVDVANAAPVAVTAGAQVAAAGPTSFGATTDSLGTNFSSPNTGQAAYWLLNVASAGTYDLKMTTGATGGISPGQVEVFDDNKEIGGVINVSASSTTDLGNLTLSAGLNTIALYVVHGSYDPSQGNNTTYYQFQPTTFTLMTPSVVALGDSGFEAVALASGGYAYAPSGSPWTFSGSSGNGSGLAANNSPFTSGNPAAPQGTQVAFLQGRGTIAQAVAGWAAGSYTISFDAAQRGNFGTSVEDFQVLVDGVVVGTYKPSGTSYQAYTTAAFAVAAGSHTIRFVGLDTAGGDNTALLDAVSVAVVPQANPTVGDSGFEAVALASGGYAYNPSGSAWTFSGSSGNGSGLAANNSPFTSGNPAAPQGTQVAFLQGRGTIAQAVAGWAAGSYTISFDAAQRGNFGTSVEDFQVLVDGVVVGTYKPSGTSYQAYTTAAFAVAAGSHTIRFVGLDTAGGDNTALLDAVSVAVVPQANPAAPALGDPGFEAVSVGAGGYAYVPSGSPWAFSATANVGGSGLASNNSAFTSGNPAAPQGTQVAFLQAVATITQAVAGWAAGSYSLSFLAAQRGNNGTSVEDFQVLIDGVVVGTFKPTSTSYQAYSTSTFTVSAGSHTVEFLGLDTAGGDNTAFLDNVAITAH